MIEWLIWTCCPLYNRGKAQVVGREGTGERKDDSSCRQGWQGNGWSWRAQRKNENYWTRENNSSSNGKF